MRKVFTVLLVVGVLLGACATPTPQIIKETVVVKETVPVEKVIKETVTVKETVVVKETRVVEKAVTQVVEKVVTATPSIPEEELATRDKPVTLRIGISAQPPDSPFRKALNDLQARHPEWRIVVEEMAGGEMQRVPAQIAAGTLPDVVRITGLSAQPWIRQGAFLNLQPLMTSARYDVTDFYPGTADEFRFQGAFYGVPAAVGAEVIYYNIDLFDKAKIPYPTDNWTWEDLRAMARKLTLDKSGKNADDPAFDGNNVVQWGYNTNPGAIAAWAHFYVEPFGCDYCANEDCTRLKFTSDVCLNTLQWWADFTSKDKATLYDPYSGKQTGTPGDPFLSGKVAIGNNGFFAVAQLKEVASFKWDIVQPPKGPTGKRVSVFSTNGYVIAANSKHPREAWRLIEELTSPDFMKAEFAARGGALPSRRSAAPVVLATLQPPPANIKAVLAALEYGHPFRPNSFGAFEVYGKIIGLTNAAMKGERPVKDAYAEAEKIANDILIKAEQDAAQKK
ncbi:MAG: extracellular solute-binding protein [Anaerolineae bacterium]|nr:extracellular solute-binding protein [Anaerolineae bacterium]